MKRDPRFPRSEPKASGKGGAEGAHQLAVDNESPTPPTKRADRFRRSEPQASGPRGAEGAHQLVLIDAVGTSIRLREAVGETYARIAAAHGVAIPAWRLDDAFARVLRGAAPMPADTDEAERAWWRGIVRATFRAADQMQRFADFEACFAALFAHFARADAWRVADGAPEAFDALRAQGRRVVIASNFDQRLHAILDGLGLAAHVDGVWLPRDAGTAKPDPAFFGRACVHYGVAPAHAVAVGDHPDEDLAAARRAGLAAIDVGALASLAALPARIAALEAHEPEEDR